MGASPAHRTSAKAHTRWRLWASLAVMTCIAGVGVALALYRLPLGPSVPPPNPTHTLRGALHLTPLPSAGPSRLDELMREARLAQLDFIAPTETNREPIAWEPPAGEGLLLLPSVAYDLPTGTALLLGDDARRSPGVFQKDPSLALARRLKHQELGLLVLGAASSWERGWDLRQVLPSFRAEGRPRLVDAAPSLGVEFLNVGTEHENEAQPPWLPVLWGRFAWLFNPRYGALSFYDRPDEALQLWDQLNADRPELVVGLCGLDARANLGEDDALALQTAVTYVVLSSPPPQDGPARLTMIEAALRQGRSYCALDLLARADGLRVEVASPHHARRWTMGDSLPMAEGLVLAVSSPSVEGVPQRISVFRDGELQQLRTGSQIQVNISKPGTWRVEVDLGVPNPLGAAPKWTTWIYANPIKVQPPQDNAP